ncbi:MAG: hypothetical protein KC443_23555, partial [Anaerolineales bacterium]|nr:hypothetical protein [Anaerolineales bacterium]
LLIADEVHRYGADVYARALEDAFDERLGLTATYEREDYGIERYLTPYFSPRRNFYAVGDEIVADCGYARGLADKILARFRVGLLGVNLTSSEQLEYQEYDEQAKRSRMFLINEHNCPEEPFGEFMRAVTKLSEGNNNETRSTIHARQYLNAFSKRRALLADCQRKLSALELLFPILTLAKRTLVFTETVHSAQRAAETLRQLGMPAFDYTSKLTREKRKERLSDFRSGKIRVLAAPRVLDEGIDVPEADIGVIVAASRSRRQMIQRMGRIIRPKPDDRLATFFVLYVHNTAEDPNYGAHSTFLSEMMDTAEEVTIFPNQVNQIELLMWFMNLK